MDTAALCTAAAELSALGCFRALPMVGAALASRQLATRAKLLLGMVFCAAVLALRRAEPTALDGLAFAYAYLVLACACVPSLARALRAGSATDGGVFVAGVAVFFVLPALLWPKAARLAALVLGWDLMLSSYSYCVELARARRDPELRDCLFFLLVNPVLVYTQRGEHVAPPALHGPTLARAAIGASTLFGATALIAPLYGTAHALAARDDTPALFVACGALRLLLEYARQSGLASLQLGLMRQLGHVVPERYVHPLSATSLQDFWRRWNTYVGQWMLRYVFSPLTLHLGRRLRARGAARTACLAAGVLSTFACVGLLHDVYAYGLASHVGTRMLQAFSANGALVLASLALAQLGAGAAQRARDGRWLVVAHALTSRVAFWAVAIGCFATWWD